MRELQRSGAHAWANSASAPGLRRRTVSMHCIEDLLVALRATLRHALGLRRPGWISLALVRGHRSHGERAALDLPLHLGELRAPPLVLALLLCLHDRLLMDWWRAPLESAARAARERPAGASRRRPSPRSRARRRCP